ncbi:MAG: Merozoite surface protein 7 [Thermoanaerobacterium thermosaccharolyticum]
MDKERLLKVLIIELFIIFFIRFQIFDGISFEKEKLLLKKKEENEVTEYEETYQNKQDNKLESKTDDEIKSNLDIFEIIEKGKNFMGSVKPYLHKREQYYIDIFTKIAEILECHKQLIEYQNQGTEIQEDNFDQIGMLKAVKPYMKEDKQIIIDKFIKLHEGIQNLNEKMKKYEIEDNKNNVIDKILDIFEALKPVIPDDRQDMAEKIIKNIKLVEALNKAESIMNSKNSADKDKKESNTESNTRSDSVDIPKNIEKSEEIESDVNNKNIEKAEEIKSDVNNLKEVVDSLEDADDGNEDDGKQNLGLTSQQSAVVDSLKSMLTKEQQQFMYNMINYLKQQSADGNFENNENDRKDVDGAGG